MFRATAPRIQFGRNGTHHDISDAWPKKKIRGTLTIENNCGIFRFGYASVLGIERTGSLILNDRRLHSYLASGRVLIYGTLFCGFGNVKNEIGVKHISGLVGKMPVLVKRTGVSLGWFGWSRMLLNQKRSILWKWTRKKTFVTHYMFMGPNTDETDG